MGHLPFAADARLTKHVCTLSSNALTVDTILNHIFKTHTRNRYGSSTDTDTDTDTVTVRETETETGEKGPYERGEKRKKGLHNGWMGRRSGRDKRLRTRSSSDGKSIQIRTRYDAKTRRGDPYCIPDTKSCACNPRSAARRPQSIVQTDANGDAVAVWLETRDTQVSGAS